MKITECPLCGEKGIVMKKGDYLLTDEEDKIIDSIHGVKYYKCNSCGEKFVDNNEVNKIIPPAKKRMHA